MSDQDSLNTSNPKSDRIRLILKPVSPSFSHKEHKLLIPKTYRISTIIQFLRKLGSSSKDEAVYFMTEDNFHI